MKQNKDERSSAEQYARFWVLWQETGYYEDQQAMLVMRQPTCQKSIDSESFNFLAGLNPEMSKPEL